MSPRRRPIVAGNWKMNTTVAEARALADEVRASLGDVAGVDIVLCPPFISLAAVAKRIRGTRITLGAQNCHFEPKGAFTGEVAPTMLADLGCRYVILGHSERRQYFGETDDLVARKARAVLSLDMTPIVCVGENLDQNEAGQTRDVVERQLRGSLDGVLPQQIASVVIAYEPVWAIGTGRAATAADANATIGFIRETLATMANLATAAATRIQYGGSVTPANAAELFAQPEIDGALIGGASLKAPDFATICRAAQR